MIQILRVSAINLDLASDLEASEKFKTYESFLRSVNYPIQISIVSTPIDLTKYIQENKQIRRQTQNPHKRALLDSYIEHAADMERREEIMQRQRLVAFAEQLKADTPAERKKAALNLIERREEIIEMLKDLELEVEILTEIEIARYFHTLFDFNAARNLPIRDTFIPEVITGGKE